MPPEKLETVDMPGVELMSAGGPYFGKGSPPDGDYFTREHLEQIAEANRSMAAELKPPNKLGHDPEQKLLAATFPLSEGEEPAAGWVDGSSFRVEERDGTPKLVADVRRVPKKLAALFESGAFRTRSVELGRLVRQTGEKAGEPVGKVVTALSWLGAKRPAIRTLDDWIGFAYEERDEEAPSAAALLAADEPPADVERIVDLAEGDLVWRPDEGSQAVRDQVQMALNPSSDEPGRYWVQDVNVRGDRAIVVDHSEGMPTSAGWVVPFRREDGQVAVAPVSEWTLAQQAWVEAAPQRQLDEKLEDDARVDAVRADTRRMKKLSQFSDEQVKTFGEGFGLTVEDVKPDELREQVAAKFSEVAPAVEQTPTPPTPPAPDDDPNAPTPPGPQPAGVQLSEADVAELKMKAEKGEAAFEAARVKQRDALITDAVKEGRLNPEKVDEWRGFYDATPEMAERMLAELPINEDLVRAYGSDDDGSSSETIEGVSYEDSFEARFGRKAVV